MGKTMTFSGGLCERFGSSFQVHIGRLMTLNAKDTTLRSFSVGVFAAKDGTYENFSVDWRGPQGSGSIVRGTLKIEGGHTRGSFAGRVVRDGKYHGTASGTFACR